MQNLCPQCGAPVNNNTGKCEYCGAAVPVQQPPQQPVYQQPVYQQPVYQQPIYQQPVYQQPVYQQPTGLAPIRKRNIFTCILLCVVTFGIYGLIWFINMVDDANTASRTASGTSGGMVFLLTLITCGIYLFVWFFKVGQQLADAKRYATGVHSDGNGVLYLILSLLGLGIVSYCLIQNELNQVAAY